MHERVNPTPFADVNVVLEHFRARIQALLERRFLGMYVIGSLALGDFDPSSSDIDFIVLTDTNLPEALVRGLQDIHEQFAGSSSSWATKIEAVYVPQAALGPHALPTAEYPQIEKGTILLQAALEPGWVFQCWTLREHGIVVAGPNPRMLVAPVEPQAMRAAVVAIAGEWLDAAYHDPSWLVWLRQRQHHTFVIQTLCRMLYSLATGEVTSKLRAMQWAQHAPGTQWATLIERSLATQDEAGQLTQSEVKDTIALIRYTVTQGQRGAGLQPPKPITDNRRNRP
jgi:hypothetical protein